MQEYSADVAAFAYGLPVEDYIEAVDSMYLEKGKIYILSSIFTIPKFK